MPAGGAGGSDFAAALANERARTGRIVHQDTVPSLAPSRRRPILHSYATIDQSDAPGSAAYTETSFTERRSRVKYAASLDQGVVDLVYFAARSSSPERPPVRKRPPLQHGVCFDQSDFEFTTRPPTRQVGSERTPVLDEDAFDSASAPRSEESDDHGTISYDTDTPMLADFFKSLENKDQQDVLDSKSFGESVEATYERSYKNRTSEYFYDRAGPSSENSSTYFKSDDIYETGFSLNDPLQIQRMSVTALFEKFCADEREVRSKPAPIRQTSEINFHTSRLKGISADRIGGGFVKKSRADRVSTSSLGDPPASGSCFSIFDKRKGKLGKLEKSKRLSTSALYDQSPTSNLVKSNRIRSTEIYKKFDSEEFSGKFSPGEIYSAQNAPSTSKSDNSVSKFRFGDNPLERASVTKLYEKFCYDDKIKPLPFTPFAPKQSSFESNEPKSAKTEPFSAASLSERTSDIMSSTLLTNKIDDTVFTFDTDTIRECSENRSDMSPDRSASASNTMQLIFEDPRSNRTSVSDLYEPCFSISLAPKRPSLKRDLSRHWDLNTLDLRPIDDESPTTSKLTSTSSPDDILQNYDSKSNSSDIFVTTDFQTYSNGNGKGQFLEDIHEGGSFDDQYLSNNTSSGDSDILLPKTISSRPSMHKLQPYKPKHANMEECKGKSSEVHEASKTETNTETLIAEDVGKLSLNPNCEELADEKLDKKTVFSVKKQKDNVTLRKRTRCFPL